MLHSLQKFHIFAPIMYNTMKHAMYNHIYNTQALPQVACCHRGFNDFAFTVLIDISGSLGRLFFIVRSRIWLTQELSLKTASS